VKEEEGLPKDEATNAEAPAPEIVPDVSSKEEVKEEGAANQAGEKPKKKTKKKKGKKGAKSPEKKQNGQPAT